MSLPMSLPCRRWVHRDHGVIVPCTCFRFYGSQPGQQTAGRVINKSTSLKHSVVKKNYIPYFVLTMTILHFSHRKGSSGMNNLAVFMATCAVCALIYMLPPPPDSSPTSRTAAVLTDHFMIPGVEGVGVLDCVSLSSKADSFFSRAGQLIEYSWPSLEIC